eukprot:3132469-Rhodomonas_salina.1
MGQCGYLRGQGGHGRVTWARRGADSGDAHVQLQDRHRHDQLWQIRAEKPQLLRHGVALACCAPFNSDSAACVADNETKRQTHRRIHRRAQSLSSRDFPTSIRASITPSQARSQCQRADAQVIEAKIPKKLEFKSLADNLSNPDFSRDPTGDALSPNSEARNF